MVADDFTNNLLKLLPNNQLWNMIKEGMCLITYTWNQIKCNVACLPA